ncbi:unnamed protein product, partial [Prorocentrum cordatum]
LRMSPLFSAADGGDREGSASRPAGSRRTWGRARGAALSETKNKHGAERTGPPLWGTAWGAGPQRGERGGPRRRSLCDSARRHTGGTRAISAASVRRGQHEEVLEEEEEAGDIGDQGSATGQGMARQRSGRTSARGGEGDGRGRAWQPQRCGARGAEAPIRGPTQCGRADRAVA